MGFGIFEGLWLTISGTVIWSRDVDFGFEGRISFRLKRKDSLRYVVMAFTHSAASHYQPMDLGDLQDLEKTLLATKRHLDVSRLQALAQARKAETMRLGAFGRIWRWVISPPLWEEDVSFRGGIKIRFRIRRAFDKRAEISFRSGEDTLCFRLRLRELEALEDALCAAKAALEQSGNQD